MGSGWINILIFVLVIGAPTIGTIWKKLEEKKEQRRIESERLRLREDNLRTGRVQTLQSRPAEPARSSSAGDIDAQRRTRLEELRRRQQERLRQAAQARPRTQQTQVRSIPAPGAGQSTGRAAPGRTRPVIQPQAGPRRTVPTRTPTRTQQSRPPTQRTARPQQSRPATPHLTRVAKLPSERALLPSELRNEGAAGRGVKRTSPLGISPPSMSGAPLQGTARAKVFGTDRPTITDLRRAVLLREMFDLPVSMREKPPGSF